MERGENIHLPVRLPRVSRETLDQISNRRLTINQESFNRVGITERDPLINTLLRLDDSFFKAGGLHVYLLLAREAHKTGVNLPSLSLEDIRDYFESHPFIQIGRAEKLEIRELVKEIHEVEAKAEYAAPSFEKFKPENPHLINHLEQAYNLVLENARIKKDPRAAIVFTGWVAGALYTYELLRNQSEKERMKGLNL